MYKLKRWLWRIQFFFKTHVEYHPVIFMGILTFIILFLPNLWSWVTSFKLLLFVIGLVLTIYLLAKKY